MQKTFTTTLLIFSLALIGGAVSAKQSAQPMGAMAPPEPPDPKRKKPGEKCKASDECQRHHECKKEGDKGICTAPQPPKLPPGVVT